MENYGAEVSVQEGDSTATFNSPEAVEAPCSGEDLVYVDKAAKIYRPADDWEALQADHQRQDRHDGDHYLLDGQHQEELPVRGGRGDAGGRPNGVRCPTGGNGIAIPAKGLRRTGRRCGVDVPRAADRYYQTASWAKQTGYMPLRLLGHGRLELKAYFTENPTFQVAVSQMVCQPVPVHQAASEDRIHGRCCERIFVAQEPVQKA